MRIIDADAFKEGWIDSTLGNTMRTVIDGQPTIDPESLPVVQHLRAELEKVKVERDAAVKDLRECAIEIEADCMYCSHEINGTLCRNCINGANWEWRGVKEG